MNGLSLFAGIGAMDLAVREVFGDSYSTVCYVEREIYCAEVLAARMADKSLSDAPIWSNICSFPGWRWWGCVDIVTASPPCQPYSLAGKQKGNRDERALGPEVVRVVRATEPGLLFFENVPGYLKHIEPLYNELCSMGFVFAPPAIFSAQECGAPHIRRRLFVLAAHPERVSVWDESWRSCWQDRPGPTGPRGYNQDSPDTLRGRCNGGQEAPKREAKQRIVDERTDCDAPDTNGGRCQGERSSWILDRERETLRGGIAGTPWQAESPVLRMADGPTDRVDRLRAIGNAVVPQQVAAALRWQLEAITPNL